MARPSKLSIDLRERFLDHIRLGLPIESAASLAGIHRDTYYEWKRRGNAAATGPFREFSDALKKAEAEAQANLLLAMRDTPNGWQRFAWILERCWPDEWGQRMELRGNKERPIHYQLEWPDDVGGGNDVP